MLVGTFYPSKKYLTPVIHYHYKRLIKQKSSISVLSCLELSILGRAKKKNKIKNFSRPCKWWLIFNPTASFTHTNVASLSLLYIHGTCSDKLHSLEVPAQTFTTKTCFADKLPPFSTYYFGKKSVPFRKFLPKNIYFF